MPEEFDLTASVYTDRQKQYSSYMECYLDESTGKYTPDYDGNLFYNTTTSNTALFGIGDLSYNHATRELSIPLLRQFPWWTYRTPETGTMVSFAYTMYDNTGMVFKDCEQVTVENVNVYVQAAWASAWSRAGITTSTASISCRSRDPHVS